MGTTHRLGARTLAALCLAVAVLAGLGSLNGVVQGFDWFPALILPVLAIHLSCGLLRGLPSGLRWAAGPVALLIALFALGQHPAMDSTGYAATSLQWFLAVLSEAGLELSTQLPPVASSRFVAFLILVLALVISLLVELLVSVRRLALLVIIPLAFAPVIASLFKQEGAGIWYLVTLFAALLGFVALLPYLYRGQQTEHTPPMPGRRTARWLGATALVCVVAMLAASFWMPGFRRGMMPEGTRPSGDLLASNVDPLLNLGRDLRANNGSTILSYYTTADHAPYLRTSVIDDLSGARWEPTTSWPTTRFYGDTAMPTQFTTYNADDQLALLQWDKRISSPVLPLPDRSNFLQGIVGNWDWTEESQVARLDGDALAQTSQLTVSYSELDLSAPMARNLGFFGGSLDEQAAQLYRELPDDPEGTLGPALDAALTEAFAADSPTSDFDKAVALQDYFRQGNFVYSERTPLREGYDGANARVVQAFLERRQGYCVHFASAMALLARQAGIPSRIVVGYAPGQATGETLEVRGDESIPALSQRLTQGTELTGYSVSGQQSHAWPELFLPGLGWIPFEPTPGQGQTPSYAPEPTSSAEPQENTPEEVPTERPTANPSASAPATPEPAAGATGSAQSPRAWWPVALLGALGLLALGIAPWRRQHLRTQRDTLLADGGPEAAGSLWLELRALGADAGVPHGEHESVSDYTQRLTERVPEAGESLELLGATLQESFYAERHPHRDQAPALHRALNELRTQLRQQLAPGARVKAALFPASLRTAGLRTGSLHRER